MRPIAIRTGPSFAKFAQNKAQLAANAPTIMITNKTTAILAKTGSIRVATTGATPRSPRPSNTGKAVIKNIATAMDVTLI